MHLTKVNADRIIISKKREDYDSGEVFLLAKSIALVGLLSPIIVVSLAHSDRYEIVSGNKRYYACRLLGIKEIPAIVIKAEPNFARTALHRGNYGDFFKEADDVKETLTKNNLTHEELGNLLAYTKKEILSLINLSSMTDLEREIVKNNYITKEIVSEIASVHDEQRRNLLLSEIANQRPKKETILNLIAREKRGKPALLKSHAQRTPKFKDLRLFDNTLLKAVKLLKESGVKAQIDTEKTPNITEYKIKIQN